MSLRHNDLRDCIYPEISVDEYESKTGKTDEVIVIAFYTTEEDVANDLDDFIEKSFIEVLDVDVSPNPTEDGKYMVFVELKRLPDFFKKFKDLIKDVENLSGKLEWMATTRALDHEVSVDDPELEGAVFTGDTAPIDADDDDDTTSDLADEDGIDIEDELDDSEDVEEAIRLISSDGYLVEKREHGIYVGGRYFNVHEVGSRDSVLESVSIYPMALQTTFEERDLNKALGDTWVVTQLEGVIVLEHKNMKTAMVLGV